ncbi:MULTISPECIES: bifunctional 2-polyprenyl-6-hydroxyphenol methylase/3-demethylubiquinol 3-O-methyltransferase UbiG [unclassified Oceanispirochaeta]|uniref:class I SAM-dependent methyltransferase n=1 Tax=unclassified Oceanispirochaeta TaxID=2635722 RepID=UPI000E09DDB2|nr:MULTISPECIES: class I SAM-dependent methyltransferase [unclassified Oceanispirochaeta]MBF9015636.1 class I SAM-dependent methyltransferase [Oceanispirochaeta sp. M2]NPD73410.1 class I SAM-dependent methyltransferase [Oceanispirochaeta sp. M1]RDG30884.1 class I SAM-dependent methyltransferase [Oceanispirochaeta sp. M1]
MSEDSWFSDEWFWKNYGPIMFDEERMASSAYEAKRIREICGLKEGASVFDCCCGMGRHSVEMAEAGCKVTAVDLSPGYIEMARDAAKKHSVNVDFINQDIRSIDYQECFDAVINMFSSFGYFDDPHEDLELLKKLHRSLKQGGTLFMEMSGKEVIARDFEERTWFEREGLKILLEYSVDLNWTELCNHWLFFKDDKMTEYSFSHRIFSAAEMADLLWKAGFSTIEIYGDFEQSPYDHKAKNLILVGRKD